MLYVILFCIDGNIYDESIQQCHCQGYLLQIRFDDETSIIRTAVVIKFYRPIA